MFAHMPFGMFKLIIMNNNGNLTGLRFLQWPNVKNVFFACVKFKEVLEIAHINGV